MPYERFDAWKRCHSFALAVYAATANFPKSELYGLTSQLRRAAYSAAANLAEGSARKGSREFSRFLNISLGSLAEAAYALRLARDLHLLSEATWNELEMVRADAGRLTWRLYESVRKSAH